MRPKDWQGAAGHGKCSADEAAGGEEEAGGKCDSDELEHGRKVAVLRGGVNLGSDRGLGRGGVVGRRE